MLCLWSLVIFIYSRSIVVHDLACFVLINSAYLKVPYLSNLFGTNLSVHTHLDCVELTAVVIILPKNPRKVWVDGGYLILGLCISNRGVAD